MIFAHFSKNQAKRWAHNFLLVVSCHHINGALESPSLELSKAPISMPQLPQKSGQFSIFQNLKIGEIPLCGKLKILKVPTLRPHNLA